MKTTRVITIIGVSLTLLFASVPAVFAHNRDVPVCPLDPQDGRIITTFDPDQVIKSNSSEGNAQSGPIATSIPEGTYDVTLVTYDNHGSKGGQGQIHEEWFAILENASANEVTQTPAISDLPDNSDVLTQLVATDFSIDEDVVFVKAFHNAYPDGEGGANSLVPVCAAFDELEEEQTGSIRICKAIVDEEWNIVDGSENSGTFSIAGIDHQDAAGVLPTTEFQTPLTLSADVFENISGNDAQCTLYDELEIGHYFYDEESVTGENWQTPLYNDQFTHAVEGTEDFFTYEFDGDNSNADGDILLTEERPDRELIILNQYITEPEGECELTLTKDDDKDPVSPGEELKYTLTLENTGDGNCTGPGVELQDFLPFGTSYVSHTLTPEDHDTESANIIQPDYVEINLGTMPPGDLVELEITVLVDQDVSCESTLINEARYWSTETGNGDLVEESTLVQCDIEPPQCSDGIDNDGDGNVDHPEDQGCDGPDDKDENSPPAIILLGDNPLSLLIGGPFTDPGATADDFEDGDITGDISVGGDTVDPNTLGAYTVTYDVTDSDGAAAPQVTRIVNVVEESPQCSDGEDNDGDGNIDHPEDPSCDSPEDDDENTPPEITVLGDNPLNVVVGSSFTDPGATALDVEDGDLTPDIVTGGDTVDSNTLGSYTITYDVDDSQGASATQKTRTVNVTETTPECSDEEDNDGDQLIDADDPTCHTDNDPENPESYDPNIDNENSPPEITILGDNPLEVLLGETFSDPGVTASDLEDGDITGDVVINGDTVNTNVEDSYDVIYRVTDSGGLTDEKTRVVNVVPFTPTECNDGIDNDSDGLIDISDNGCHTDNDENNFDSYDPEDDDENTAPTITLNGDSAISLTVGDSFTDPGATALDVEDGNVTDDIVTGGDTVDSNTLGSYTITYDVDDSQGASAPQVTRTVTVGSGGGGGGCTTNCGGGLPPLEITNEAVTVPSAGVAVVTWKTNIPATSQAVYDDNSHDTPTVEPDYGYESVTTETTGITSFHRVEIAGLTPGIPYYFRPVSKAPNVPRGIGDEVTFTIPGEPPVVPPGGPTQCTYLEDYLRIDFDNDPEEVTKLQTFLRDFEGFTNLQVTGIFDQATFDAVSEFQARYGSEVLAPWGLPDTTGYVYYTTQKKVNEIFCNQALSFTTAQLTEIDGFRTLLEELQTQPGVPAEEIEGLEGQVGVAPGAPATGGGGALAIGEAEGENVLEGSAAVGALGIIPEGSELVQEGTQAASLIGTVGTSGVLAVFADGGPEGASEEEAPRTEFLATALGTLNPSVGRGITIAGIVILLAYLALSRVQERGGAVLATQKESSEEVPDVHDEGEGTILEV